MRLKLSDHSLVYKALENDPTYSVMQYSAAQFTIDAA